MALNGQVTLRMRRARNASRLLAVLATCVVAALAAAAPPASAEPVLQRFRAATIAAPDLATVEADYSSRLGYVVRERGRVSRALAASWGAPRAAGRPYLLLSSDAAPDVYIRAVQAPAARDYKPLTTWGWNAIEIVVDDTDATFEKVRGGPFRVIGEPANLSGYPSIRAFQVEGRSGEVLYLTSETGDRSRSPLPAPNGAIGRIFIMVVAAGDAPALVDWYAKTFGLSPGALRDRPVGVLQRAQGLGPDALLPLTTARLAQPGNLLELDGYSANAGPRKVRRGELPPGIAITTMSVRSLDDVRATFLQPPAVGTGMLYAGRRTATVRGVAGELIELVEE